MNKKTRLIPFDWEKYKSGMKPVFRNREEKIISIHKRYSTVWPILVVAEDKNSFANLYHFGSNGRINSSEESGEDILLEEEIKEITLYVNVWPEKASFHFSTLEGAREWRHIDQIGTLKITYTEEDLIK